MSDDQVPPFSLGSNARSIIPSTFYYLQLIEFYHLLYNTFAMLDKSRHDTSTYVGRWRNFAALVSPKYVQYLLVDTLSPK